MATLVQQLINGLSVGSTYALIALGYTMVYGVLRLINFAHGDVYMVGAVVGFHLARWMMALQVPLHLALAVVFLGSMLACAVLGFLIERFAYRPLRHRPRLVMLITAIGVSLLLENLAQLKIDGKPLIFGPDPQRFPALIPPTPFVTFDFGPGQTAVLTNLDVLSMSVSLVLMLLLTCVVMRTRTGLALRAVSHRVDTAMLLGINTNRIISFTFILASALAAVAGVLDGIRYDVRPLMGILPGLKAFIAAVLGGIGSIPGALVGGLLLGMIETAAKATRIGGVSLSPYADAFAFMILILILLVRPGGLFGRQAPEKV